MKTESLWKWIVLVILLAFSAVLISKKDNIRLGLDLQGGSGFTLQLNEEELKQSIKDQTEAEGKTISEEELARKVKEIKDKAKATSVDVVRRRIDSLGTEEPIIYAGSGDECRVYVQIPGASAEKRQQAKEIIQRVAHLSFALVDDSNKANEKLIKLSNSQKAPEGYKCYGNGKYIRDNESKVDYNSASHKANIRRFGNPTPGSVFMLVKENNEDGLEIYSPIFVKRKVELTGEMLDRAKHDVNPTTGKREINLSFNNEGRKKFADVTGKNVGKQLAVILDDIVYSAPRINDRIDGDAVITGDFSIEEARQLQNVLNAGSLPVPLEIIEERHIDPTLGSDTIAASKNAIIVGCVAILLFLVFYYRTLGVVASVALILNIVLLPIFAILASNLLGIFAQDATSGSSIWNLPVLTLPGIAGILLTIGMAVDANVLIFERTREELANNRPTFASIMAGYQRAFLAIFDGNITTIITAIILFIYGTGLIRGFSITLVAGILVSMFTALVVTKLIFQATIKPTSTMKIKMMELVPPSININFIKGAKKFIIVAVLLIVVLDAVTLIRGIKNPNSIFAIDFTGGSKVSFVVNNKEKAPLEKIREALNKIGIEDANPQYQSLTMDAVVEAAPAAVETAPAVEAAPAVVEAAPAADTNAVAAVEAAPAVVEAAPAADTNAVAAVEAAPAAVQAPATVETKSQEISYIEITTIKTKDANNRKISDVMEEVLNQEMPEAGFTFKSNEEIGSQIGDEMKTTAYIAITLSTLAMLIYITLRFEFGFSLGAIVALVHDVLITIGIFSALGFKFNLTIVAAMLTIVGYGVNDTIVLFDRIREELKLNNKLTFPELANKCINVTLSRTLLTSITTLITVVSLMIFTTGDIFGFATCMLIGIIVSTFSTIYIATPVMLAWYKNKRPNFAKK